MFIYLNVLYYVVGGNKIEEARKKREEKKLQRQKELEARRANRLGGSKLGAKKA